jgi:hypothetical protein
MKWNFLWCIAGGIGCLNIIRTSVKYSGNPLLSGFHLWFVFFALVCFGLAWVVYNWENN